MSNIKYKTKRQRAKAVAQSQYKWKKNNLKCINFRLNINNDKDILDKLESVENMTDYIRQLIRKDLEENKA